VFEKDVPDTSRGYLGNTKKYFVEPGEYDIVGHMMYDKKLARIKHGINRLKDELFAKTKVKFGLQYPDWCRDIAITEPVCGCAGVFKTSEVPFMANPNQDYDEWLTSDQELEILERLTNNFANYGF
jgi:hypothetical protein